MGRLAAGDGYEVALVEGRVAARATSGRAAGRQLKSLPKAQFSQAGCGGRHGRRLVAHRDSFVVELGVLCAVVSLVEPGGVPVMLRLRPRNSAITSWPRRTLTS